MTDQVPAVYGAISDVMAKLAKEGIAKNSKNVQQGYKFRGIDDVYNALSPFLAECKLVILPRVLKREVTERETKNGGALFYVVLDVEFDFVAAVDGSRHVVRVVGEAMDSGDKATNKAMSAAYKYACMEAFCIPTEGDNDADAQTHEVKAKESVDPKECNKYVSLLVDALNVDVTEEIRAEMIWKLRQELNGRNELTDAVWDKLENKQRRAIKLYIDQHGKTINEPIR